MPTTTTTTPKHEAPPNNELACIECCPGTVPPAIAAPSEPHTTMPCAAPSKPTKNQNLPWHGAAPSEPMRAHKHLLRHRHKTRPRRETTTAFLDPPRLNSGTAVTGSSTPRLRLENKKRRIHLQLQQHNPSYWTEHTGHATLPTDIDRIPIEHKNKMCPTGLALHHPAAALLLEYATKGCPVLTGKNWTREQMEAAIQKGPHASALTPDASKQLDMEVNEKVQSGQARLVRWSTIRANPPKQLKISPVAMIEHKSRRFRAILDLSFSLKLSPIDSVPSVNSATTKTAPAQSIDQLGHSLQRIIHAFASADDNAKVFLAKWDIKDGFWRLDCATGEEWNFCYVLPSSIGSDPVLVVPTSLQMGWIESPAYFCTASETARDVAATYTETAIDSLTQHKFLPLTQLHEEFQALPQAHTDARFYYLIEVFMDDYIGLAIPTSQSQLNHVANSVMHGIHDVFPPDPIPENDPISNRKLKQRDGSWATVKDILGLTFDGAAKTIWLAETKRDALIAQLKQWIRLSSKRGGIAFDDFQSTISKLQHAFITIPAGRGLLSPFYTILALRPRFVFLHTNEALLRAVQDCRTFLRESVSTPTKCKNLVTGWPDYVGITDASGHGLGGVIIGDHKGVTPTVFRMQWPKDITAAIVSDSNPHGSITNSDLEMAGLLMLWLVMEEVCQSLTETHVALFSDNSPTVHWVQRLAAKHSKIAIQLIRALALRLQLKRASPLTPLHIAGVDNAMTDIPSRSFGSEPKWHCLLDCLPPFLRDSYAADFHSADEGFYRGRVATSTDDREKYWSHWRSYVAPMGMDPYLQETTHAHKTRALTGFAARVRSGYYGRRRTVRTGTVSSAITAVGTTISLATGVNPTKVATSEKFIPRLAQMLQGWKKEDPPPIKKLPIEVDIPEYLAAIGAQPGGNELDKAVGDLALIAFYYLLRIGEYTIKGHRNETKQTVQFRLSDVTFFRRDSNGCLRQMTRDGVPHDYLSADSATLKLDNQKNGWKGVCVHQEANGDDFYCPVKALARRYNHIGAHTAERDTFLSAFFVDGHRFDVTDKDIRFGLKAAAGALHYPVLKGIPIARIDTHSLRSGGANALSLSGYSDREIQKMGRWRGATFKEYIREELACFSAGMSRNMKRKFNFVNIAGGVYTDVTDTVILLPYSTTATAA